MGDVVKHTVEIDGYHLVVTGDDEAMIEDAELAKKLRFKNVSDLRKLAKRLRTEGFLHDSEVLATVAETSRRGGRPGVSYRFTRPGALKIVSRSETAVAGAIMCEVIAVYDAYQRGMLRPVPASAPQLPPDESYRYHSRAELGDLTVDQVVKLRQRISDVAEKVKCHVQAIYGVIRRECQVLSYFRIPQYKLDRVDQIIQDVRDGKLRVKRRQPSLVDPRQVELFRQPKNALRVIR